ncbi:MAG: hypothetical protein LCH51_15080 [Bacteroidetes bacterium]|nr:hypothetical protein [Bacteroidota bacterium]
MSFDFSFRRLQLLVRKQWLENRRFYMLSFTTIAILVALSILLFWFLPGGSEYEEGELMIFYLVGLFVINSIFASMAFQALGNKEKGQYVLTLPATHGEKLINALLFSMLFFPVVYSAIFWVLESIAVQLVMLKGAKIHRFTDFANPHNVIIVLAIYLAVTSLFLLGSVYFKRYAFIKTVIVSAAIFSLYAYLINVLGKSLVPDGFRWEFQKVFNYNPLGKNSPVYYEYSLDRWAEAGTLFLVKYIWAPFFWFVTWLRLKEKEI